MKRISMNASKGLLKTWTRKFFTVTYNNHLSGEYNRYFWNYFNSIIFGANAYHAYKEQKNNLMNQIVKPFGISVEAAFRRVKIITNMMEYFPPPCSNDKEPT